MKNIANPALFTNLMDETTDGAIENSKIQANTVATANMLMVTDMENGDQIMAGMGEQKDNEQKNFLQVLEN